MTKIALALLALITFSTASAQLKPKKDWSKVKLDQAGDHIMIQLSSDHWSGAPDSISSRMKGLSRGMNVAVMLNKPFKSDPRWSVALGLGASNSSIFFEKTNIDLTTSAAALPFTKLDGKNYFKKYKLATTYVEVPVELRYTVNPEEPAKSWKAAIGVKVGTILNAHTKGKTLLNSTGNSIGSFTQKQSSSMYFNSSRIAATARVGYGHFAVFAAYTLTSFLKDGAGASIKPYQIGLAVSGL